jgi:hypothetical protein
MGKGKLERFTLAAIADALDASDVATARRLLSAVVGALAVCLSDCRLQEKKQVINRKETGNGKPQKTSDFGSITKKEQ